MRLEHSIGEGILFGKFKIGFHLRGVNVHKLRMLKCALVPRFGASRKDFVASVSVHPAAINTYPRRPEGNGPNRTQLSMTQVVEGHIVLWNQNHRSRCQRLVNHGKLSGVRFS
jgi:hypothetical protein